jgi:hypothetical protein
MEAYNGDVTTNCALPTGLTNPSWHLQGAQSWADGVDKEILLMWLSAALNG